MFISGNNISRGNGISPTEVPLPLPQCLSLEPIALNNQRYTRSGELRRVLGAPLGSTSEDNSFGINHSKPSPPVVTEELKHFKVNVEDSRRKARDRANMFRGHLFSLDKYNEALSSKKQQCGDLSSAGRLVGPKLTKMGNQISRSSTETTHQRLDDRVRSIGPNKRAHALLVDEQTNTRCNGTVRQQMVTEGSEDTIQDLVDSSIELEQKIHKRSGGGEAWDAKMKKKRSISMVTNRGMNIGRDVKRTVDQKLSVDSKLRPCDLEGLRLMKSSQGVSGQNNMDDSSEPFASGSIIFARREIESNPVRRDHSLLLEKKVVTKDSNRPKSRETNLEYGPNPAVRGKLSKAPRTGSIMLLDSSAKSHTTSGNFQDLEMTSSAKKVSTLSVEANQRLIESAGSSPHAIAQWGGHKNSRTRRFSLASPVSIPVESQFRGFPSSDFSPRNSVGTNGSIIASCMNNNSPKIKMELESASPLFGLSESEESGAGENKLKEKETNSGEVVLTTTQKGVGYMLCGRKNKTSNEIRDCVRKQGKCGRGFSSPGPVIPLVREGIQNIATTKPYPTRPACDKSKSRSGRPPTKKMNDRKAIIRVGPVQNVSSVNYVGERDDDREDLYSVASSARNSSNMSCSGPFWKKKESHFTFISSEQTTYLKQEVSLAKELNESLSLMCDGYCTTSGDLMLKVVLNCSAERSVGHSNKACAKTDFCGKKVDAVGFNKVNPLYQRILSALIEEDETEEVNIKSEGKNMNMSFHYASDDSYCGSCNQIDMESKDLDRMEYEAESTVDFQAQKNCYLDRFSCAKSGASNPLRNPSMSNSLISNGRWLGDDDFAHSDVSHVSEICSEDMSIPPSSPDCQYHLMSLEDKLQLELQSIGLFPEPLPDLAEGEDMIDHEIMQLSEGLFNQTGSKKKNLDRVSEAIQKGNDVDKGNLERVAMEQLVETAYRRRMACNGSNASRTGVRKMSRPVASAFIKRVLGRCKKYEDTGISCFSEPALQKVLFANASRNGDFKSVACVGSKTASNTGHLDIVHNLEPSSSMQATSKTSALNSRVTKRKTVIDDVVGSATSGVTSTSASELKTERSRIERGQRKDNLTPGGDTSLLHGSRTEHKQSKQKLHHHSSNYGNNPKEAAAAQPAYVKGDSLKEAAEIPMNFGNELEGLDSVEELGSWFNFEEDGLQDHDSLGLEIPMDDLSDLNMLM